MKIKEIKEFAKENKSKIINVVCIVVGGLFVYGFTRPSKNTEDIFESNITISKSISNAVAKDTDYNFKTFDEAVNQFKEYQKTNNTVTMFFEDDNYQVFELEQK